MTTKETLKNMKRTLELLRSLEKYHSELYLLCKETKDDPYDSDEVRVLAETCHGLSLELIDILNKNTI